MLREHYVNIIRSLGYTFRQDGWRASIWRHPSTLHIIAVKKKDHLAEEFVRSTLAQAGCTGEQINQFLQQCKN